MLFYNKAFFVLRESGGTTPEKNSLTIPVLDLFHLFKLHGMHSQQRFAV